MRSTRSRDRAAESEVERRLLYLEPDPGGGGGAAPGGDSPSPIATILASISGLPREEPVLDDILEVNRHNDRVLRIQEIVETSFDPIRKRIEEIVGTELDRLTREQSAADIVQWRTRINEDAKAAAGFAYPTYLRSKVSGVVDSFARTICRLSNFPDDSNQAAFVRGVVRSWADTHLRRDAAGRPAPVDDLVAFLYTFDLAYRARRLRFVTDGLSAWYAHAGEPGYPTRAQLDEGKRHALGGAGAARRGDGRPQAAHEHHGRRARGLRPGADRRVHRQGPRTGRIRGRARRRARAAQAGVRRRRSMRGSPEPPRRSTRSCSGSARAGGRSGAPSCSSATSASRTGTSCSIPLQSVADAGERDTIEVVRMSPRDAKLLPPLEPNKPKQLAGFETMHFGAFFDRAGRENDYLWGRLDGAERLIGLVLGAGFTDEERADWCRKAFAAIVEEEDDALAKAKPLLDHVRRFAAPA